MSRIPNVGYPRPSGMSDLPRTTPRLLRAPREALRGEKATGGKYRHGKNVGRKGRERERTHRKSPSHKPDKSADV